MGSDALRDTSRATERILRNLQDIPLVQVLRDLAAASPDEIALTADEGSRTRGELDLESDRWGRELRQAGTQPGDFVCLVLPNGLQFFSLLLGVWKAGATPVPLNDRLTAHELAALIDFIDPAVVVGGDGTIVAGRCHLPSGHVPDPPDGVELDRAVISPAWKAIASGGSTGRPKVIVATDSAAAAPHLAPSLVGLGDHETTLIAAPLSHNGPFIPSVYTLLRGGRVVLTRFDPEGLLAAIERERATWLYLVPTMMSRIWKLPEDVRRSHDLSSLHTAVHMGAPCPAWLKRAWIDWLGPDRLIELYSSTEGVVAFVTTGREWLEHAGTVGRPLRGEVQIRDDDGTPLPSGTTGVIWVRRDPNLAPSYRYLGATSRPDDAGWETVGDIGRVDEFGYLYIEDRESDMILVGGFNAYPAEIEAALLEHPAILDCCVIGLPDDDLGQVPHAIVYAELELGESELEAHAAERLTGYKRPRSYEFANAPLRDAAGKVRRPQLVAERIAARNA